MRLFQILAGLLSAAGAVAAAIGVWLQYAAYKEEGFVRRYGAVSLAWTIVKDGNGTSHDIGQGAALQFLSDENQLFGNISLVNSFMFSSILGSSENRTNLSSSTFCGTSFMFVSMIDANISQSNFSNSHISSVFMTGVRGYGSRFDNALLMQVQAGDASFIASSFSHATLYGGNFRSADFSGADLRNLITKPLLSSPEKGGDAPRVRQPFDQKVSDAEALSAIEPNLPLAPDDATETPVDFAAAKFEHADIRGAAISPNSKSTRRALTRRPCFLGGVDGFRRVESEGDSLFVLSVIHKGSAFGEVDHADADDGRGLGGGSGGVPRLPVTARRQGAR